MARGNAPVGWRSLVNGGTTRLSQEVPMPQIDRPEDAPGAFHDVWNAHDMQAFGTLFHDDASFVNRFTHHGRGVEAIIALHAPLHETIYRDSHRENMLIDATPIRDDVTVVHFWSRRHAGPAHPAGPHAVDTLILAVLTRNEGKWHIQAPENVTLTDPRTGENLLRAWRHEPAPRTLPITPLTRPAKSPVPAPATAPPPHHGWRARSTTCPVRPAFPG
ncbi:SgcJ/EcaC family oxidoreductase [Sphingobium sufflavum]|uniref:SgcJ/EcaC family oxidoreductase n=1 Tax=Sphingobium sufflavum TaxID=1129547 RepID=UPI001F188927|nr:SgcJ/EcaC family oxidoreductase [Sphingobium sufflavum]MCE7795327.1 SgcJ/EcaC family oxidoreductase [Sphingobium sufflavum]